MKVTDLPQVHLQLIERPVTGALSTVAADGHPQVTPVWTKTDGTYIILNSKKGRLKDRNLRERPHVSLLLVTRTTRTTGSRSKARSSRSSSVRRRP